MQLAYPWFLLLYIPFLLILLYALRKPLPSIRISTIKPFRQAGSGRGVSSARLPFLICAAAIALMIFALARPRMGIENIMQRAKGIDIMLAIDLSGSMRAIDVPDRISTREQLEYACRSGEVKNRLEVAKQEIKKFIEKRPNDRIGLVGFADLPYNACPPTLDHAWLIHNLDRLHSGIVGDATGIAGPVASAVKRLKDSDCKRRVLVLFTDGSNNVNAVMSPRKAAELADEYGVTIYTVGIGSDRAYVLQNTPFGPEFFPIQGEFDHQLLMDMAKTAKGRYYAAADAEAMHEVMDEIDKLEKTAVEQPRTIEYTEYGPRIVTASLLLLLIGFALNNTLFLRLP